MKITKKILKELLIDTKIIDRKDFELVKKEAAQTKKTLPELLVKKNLISEKNLGMLIGDKIGFPFIDLRQIKIDRKILEVVPRPVAERQKIIVFEKTKKGLKVAMVQPENIEIQEMIEKKTGEKVIPYYTTSRIFKEALKFYKKGLKEEVAKLVKEAVKQLPKRLEVEALPIKKILDSILMYGYENRASDIHLEPYLKKTIIRYRIDGILHDLLVLPPEIHDFLISRIKILARLRTDIHDAPQDGHFSFDIPKEKMDIRVSIVPVEEGEKAVLRLLSEKIRRFNLGELGLRPEDLRKINKWIKKRWGMILACGPAGCGKTTTLYSIVEVLNKRKVNIISIEDPIEYDIEGVNQIQINPKTGLTFLEGLKAIIRQDPDIIMVGEIRDPETAKLAVNAAMTGHLVLSTFHATDSTTTFNRLLEMEIEPFLITSFLNLIIAQRLVRKICPKCIESYEIPFSKLAKLFEKDLASKLLNKKKKIRVYRGKGCRLCQNTGYLGRTGVFEVLEISKPLASLIIQKAPTSEIKKEALKLGMVTMVENGLDKVKQGITTLEEVVRVMR